MPVWMNDLCACNLITGYFSYSYQTVTKLSLFSELHGSSLLLVRPLSADEEDFICSESQAGCGRFRNTTLAGCYVEIAPIWNVIKVVWLHASGLGWWGNTFLLFFFFPPQMKMYSRFCWEIPGGESRLLNICNTACTVELKWVLRWVIHCGFPSDISKVCSFWTVGLL